MQKLNEFFKLNVFLYHYDIINNEVSKNFMTKKQALKEFKLIFKDFLKNNRFDYVAKRETWNNWTDSLCKDGLITSWQYENWDQPF